MKKRLILFSLIGFILIISPILYDIFAYIYNSRNFVKETPLGVIVGTNDSIVVYLEMEKILMREVKWYDNICLEYKGMVYAKGYGKSWADSNCIKCGCIKVPRYVGKGGFGELFFWKELEKERVIKIDLLLRLNDEPPVGISIDIVKGKIEIGGEKLKASEN